MNLFRHKILIPVLIVGFTLLAFGPSPNLWFTSTLEEVEEVEPVSWFDINYAGPEVSVPTNSNPNYEGILLNINNLLRSERIEIGVIKKYVKDILTLRRGDSARRYLKNICRTILKEEVTRSDHSTVVSNFLLLIDEEANKDKTRINNFIEEVMFGEGRRARRLELSRSICVFFEDAHSFQSKRTQETTEISVGLIRYLLQNDITQPIVGLLGNMELTDEMLELLLEYKDHPDLQPLIDRIDEGDDTIVSDVSLLSVENEVESIDKVEESIKVNEKASLRSTRWFEAIPGFFQNVESEGTPVKR